ncbi:MAG: hypothetical protein IT361_01325 [Gemmatimonadaceae bacterium]|nr:hypothetical protein [Gemmatimonadaceae bacterium]
MSVRQIASHLGVDESTLRYRLGRPLDAPDGRQERASVMDGWEGMVHRVLTRLGEARVTPGTVRRIRAQLVHDILVREYGFHGSYQAVRRYLQRTFRQAPMQAIHRVETPGGTAQAVVLLADGADSARHPRRTTRRLVLDPTHYEGPSTDTGRAPVPLGVRARLQLAALPETRPIARPLHEYITLFEGGCR